jgi:hypothetical protein
MPELNTFSLQVLVPKSLARAIRQQADDKGLSVSSFMRSVLKLHCQPDQATIEQCPRLVDPGVTYEVDDD